MKEIFTTGEAAKLCKVSQQTIIRRFDSGQIKGFRVPGSRFRRIPREKLLKFMKENGIPTDILERTDVLLLSDSEFSEQFRDAARAEDVHVMSVDTPFEAGMALGDKGAEALPSFIAVDAQSVDGVTMRDIFKTARSSERLRAIQLLQLRSDSAVDGADASYPKMVAIETIVQEIRSHVRERW